MTAFRNHFSFEFRSGLRDRVLLMLNYLLPLGFYFMMGLIMLPINPYFRDTMIPAMVCFAVLSAALLGLPTPLVTAREAGIFRVFKINGVPSISILVIPVLTTMLHLVIVAVIIAVSGPILFDAPGPVNWLGFFVVFLCLAFACAGLGLLIGVISANERVTVLWSQMVYLPSMLIGGLMIPSDVLPDVPRRIGMLLPTAYAMQAFNGWAQGKEATMAPLAAVLVLLVGGILALGLAIYLFSWDSRNPTRKRYPLLGLLAMLPYVVGMILLA